MCTYTRKVLNMYITILTAAHTACFNNRNICLSL